MRICQTFVKHLSKFCYIGKGSGEESEEEEEEEEDWWLLDRCDFVAPGKNMCTAL
jgi:hypothetical protein